MGIDIIKQLYIELDGIERIIGSYSRRCSAYNVIPKLQEALEIADKESIVYCLSVMSDWYKNNINKISDEVTTFSYTEHIRNKGLIEQILRDVTDYDFSKIAIAESNIDSNQEGNINPIIFLSHKSSDKKYGNILRDFIVGLGIKNNQLIYTSHQLNKIPLDANIYDYLRKNINRKVFMIILWSNEYLESPACLNEMGAAWVVQCDYTNIYVPTFSFGNPKYHECAVDTQKMGAVLNGDDYCKQSILELKNKIVDMFKLEVDESETMYLLDEMMKKLQGAN